jgi:hypothetical protein
MRLPSSAKYQQKKMGWFGSDTRDIAMFQVPISQMPWKCFDDSPKNKQTTTLALTQGSTR